MWSFPARFTAEFFDNHGMLAIRNRPVWRTVRGGSASYVEALVTPHGADAERFDQVVLATHSDQALAMLGDATDR
jgi:hypothetical protein